MHVAIYIDIIENLIGVCSLVWMLKNPDELPALDQRDYVGKLSAT